MNSLQLFEDISEKDLAGINGGYNRLAGQIGHYAGKATIAAGVIWALFG